MTKARIYRPAKTAMQSGTAKTQYWLLEMLSNTKQPTDPLMGWTGMTDTRSEIKMKFPSKEAAIAYALKNNIDFDLAEPHLRPQIKKAYADNFAFNKLK